MVMEDIEDVIYLRNLQLSAVVGPDAWSRPGKAQPLVISVRYSFSVRDAGASDNIVDTVSYGQMCKDITGGIEGNKFDGLGAVVFRVMSLTCDWPFTTSLQLILNLPKAILRVEGGIGIEAKIRGNGSPEADGYPRTGPKLHSWVWFIRALRVACIIGVNPHERLQKQDVIINIQSNSVPSATPSDSDLQAETERWRQIAKTTFKVVEASSYETLEALATNIAHLAMIVFDLTHVTVQVEKPSALTFVDGAGVEITRTAGSHRQCLAWSLDRTDISEFLPVEDLQEMIDRGR